MFVPGIPEESGMKFNMGIRTPDTPNQIKLLTLRLILAKTRVCGTRQDADQGNTT